MGIFSFECGFDIHALQRGCVKAVRLLEGKTLICKLCIPSMCFNTYPFVCFQEIDRDRHRRFLDIIESLPLQASSLENIFPWKDIGEFEVGNIDQFKASETPPEGGSGRFCWLAFRIRSTFSGKISNPLSTPQANYQAAMRFSD